MKHFPYLHKSYDEKHIHNPKTNKFLKQTKSFPHIFAKWGFFIEKKNLNLGNYCFLRVCICYDPNASMHKGKDSKIIANCLLHDTNLLHFFAKVSFVTGHIDTCLYSVCHCK